ILQDGAADARAKLVSSERRDLVIEKIASVKRAVAQELERRAVKLVAPCFRCHVDVRSSFLSKRSRSVACEYLKFSYRIDSLVVSESAAGLRAEVVGAQHLHAVEQELIHLIAAAVDDVSKLGPRR